jgi:hypothetical protein
VSRLRNWFQVLEQIAFVLVTIALSLLVGAAIIAVLANCAVFQNTGPNVPPQENLTALEGSENQRPAGRYSARAPDAGVQDCAPAGSGYDN